MIDARIVASILTDTYHEVDKVFQIDTRDTLDDDSPVTGAARVAWEDAKPYIYYCWTPKLEPGDIVSSDFTYRHFYVVEQWLDSGEQRTEKMYLSELHRIWRIWIT